ncbi:MAG: DNA-3-methyladenine glycosylase I [Gammaproteobacteria bacterium]
MCQRCGWVTGQDELYIRYHDEEWGVPKHDNQTLFEMLILEGAQAGLSWYTVLKKRENYRRLFDGFDVEKIARYSDKKLEKLLQDPGIIRNRLKVNSAVVNARAFLQLQEEEGSFSDYIWGYVDGQPLMNTWQTLKDVPVTTPASDAMSKDLKKRGFKFIGPTICYAYMQSVGMVNDHTIDCFRHKEVLEQEK